ncbi:phosphatase PAP2 family protein [Cyanobacterium stanieri LEGE 03274]|uniref:Phosphatase PAP2 family protein n=1 Tax=Cyanobacterium stanieri LEGE 03274 TaxID=1828756 RepID=A0ABR9V4S9_9CHRO|nr:phosphatase PAP2 family protein [Cyanobacterium stanieri]MBE9222882.1 phosphatase PAP2 family protein [Cyanobacterium stanieri LEGE 03274]
MKIKYIIKPKNITNHFNLLQVTIFSFVFIFFIILSYYVAKGDLNYLDIYLQELIQNNFPSWFESVARFFYFVGEAEVAVFIVLFSLIFLVWKRLWIEAQVMALSCLSVLLLIDKVLKPLFAIPRPVDRMVDNVYGYSYPSGHGSGNLLLYLLITYFITEYFPRWRFTLFTLVSILMILMGISSVYLGVHWVTDFFASYCVGYILFSISVLLHKSSE